MNPNTYNYFKTISQIVGSREKISSLLINSEKYFAHTSLNRKPELLENHVNLVINYFEVLSRVHNIDTVIDTLINELLSDTDYFTSDNKSVLGNLIKELFINTILYHDYGKINENFQAEQLKNPEFKKVANNIGSKHSGLGNYLYNVKHFQIIQDSNITPIEKYFAFFFCLVCSNSILQHHSTNLNDPKLKVIFQEEEINSFEQYIKNFQFQIHPKIKKDILLAIKNKIYLKFNSSEFKLKDNFQIFALLKLNFSLLTASDYIATSDYMSDLKSSFEKFGVFSIEEKKRIVENFKSNKDCEYNRVLYSDFDKFKNHSLKDLQEASKENLNTLRQKLSVDLIIKIRENLDKNLFYIEAPTGGGKTNLSMIALVELLSADLEKNKNEITKVFYVFPFTTLITQTYSALKKTLGLNDSEIIELHSKAGFKTKEEEDGDGVYGDKKLNYIDNLFSNYPFCLLSHIKFFDILKSNQKEINYLLYKIANSVVIIDELQSYNPDHWDKINYFIRNYAKYFNIKFILMSATLPKIGNLLGASNDEFVYLIENKEKYFNNPNFKNRTQFDFSLLEEKDLTQNKLYKTVFDKSVEYCNLKGRDSGCSSPCCRNTSVEYCKLKGRVFTIIEFIYKKSATEFYEVASKENKFFDEIFVLSGTILEPRRKEIINYLKKNKDEKIKILLITTQVVEAGVDIDMDIGFKNKSLIDSDEQLAGRINRNASKKDSILYIFELNEPKTIYGKDLRYKETKGLSHFEYERILREKDFDFLYKKVMSWIEKYNTKKMAADNLNAYIQNISDLKFNKVNEEFKLIEQENQSIFVPIEIPIQIPNANAEDKNFSDHELRFLTVNNKYDPNKDITISGKNVWELYEGLIHNKNPEFMEGKADFKMVQGIMSKFVFSIFANPETIKSLSTFGQDKYGFIYLENNEKIYDYKFGINESELKYSNFF